jgi:hypothetical protein
MNHIMILNCVHKQISVQIVNLEIAVGQLLFSGFRSRGCEKPVIVRH